MTETQEALLEDIRALIANVADEIVFAIQESADRQVELLMRAVALLGEGRRDG